MKTHTHMHMKKSNRASGYRVGVLFCIEMQSERIFKYVIQTVIIHSI